MQSHPFMDPSQPPVGAHESEVRHQIQLAADVLGQDYLNAQAYEATRYSAMDEQRAQAAFAQQAMAEAHHVQTMHQMRAALPAPAWGHATPGTTAVPTPTPIASFDELIEPGPQRWTATRFATPAGPPSAAPRAIGTSSMPAAPMRPKRNGSLVFGATCVLSVIFLVAVVALASMGVLSDQALFGGNPLPVLPLIWLTVEAFDLVRRTLCGVQART